MKKKFSISRIGLGTVQFGIDYGFGKVLSQNEVNGILKTAHGEGITFLDTAREYGNSEQKLGKACRQNPGRFTVATKLAPADSRLKSASDIRRFLEDSIKVSRRALGDAQPTIFLLHQTDRGADTVFWKVLADLKHRHGIRFGVSVYDPGPTSEIVQKWGSIIDCVQAPYNVLDRRFEQLAKLFEENGTVFISRSTFLKGALVEPRLPEELKGLEPVRERLREISKKSGLLVSQLLALFVVESPCVDCSLIGVSSAKHFQEFLGLNGLRKRFLKVKEELADLKVSDPFLADPRQWKSL